MILSKGIVFIMTLFLIAGGLDKIAGNHLGLGQEFENGFHALGPLALTMAGITSLSPLLSGWLSGVVGPLAAKAGINPAMAPALMIPVDTGCYPLAHAMTPDGLMADFASLIVASMLAASVTFSVPVALSIIRKEDYGSMAMGTMAGLIALPAGCLAGGLLLGLPVDMVLLNLLPVIGAALVLAAGLFWFPDQTIRFFVLFGRGVVVVITLALITAAAQEMTGVTVVKGMAPLKDSFIILGSIAVMLSGAYPMMAVIRRYLKGPLGRAGRYLGVNETAMAGFLSTLANNVPMMAMVKDMDERGKVLNFAFATCAAFTLGDHLGFCSAVAPERIGAMVCGKLAGGVAAVGVALWLVRERRGS
ncbi:ethanolamine utilization protein EutH [Enterocloster aldenensis]|uniref:Ethanolamine utilization protein EutH n=1 Tax=Enterocloster aldenensis TaxID=358742 RepID=A0AAW5C2Y6_9FIRM|nr:ethanolamine utilization protein EutH [Enterocloster aldenensis]